MSDWGSACGPDCGYCGACTAGASVIERTCAGCGGPVYVGRDEDYQIIVECSRCLTDDVIRESRSLPQKDRGGAKEPV